MRAVQDERHAMLAAIIDSSQDAIISKDLNSRITSWNKSAERMFGYTEAEMIGHYIHKLIPAERQSEEDKIIASLRAGQSVEHFETIRLSKDGRELRVSLMISPVRDAAGRVIGASKIARDITRQRLNEERLVVINEVGKSISAHLDEDKIMQVVTDATTKLCEAAFGAFIYNKVDAGGRAYLLYALSGLSKEAFEKAGMPLDTAIFDQFFSGSNIVRSDNIQEDVRSGKLYPGHGMLEGLSPVVSFLAVPVVSPGGIVIGGLFFVHPRPARFNDEHESLITAVAAQAAIALDNAKLYEEINILNGKKDKFIGFASHELKTPLATIKGYLQLTEERKLPLTGYYPRLYKQIARLENIIAELLDVSRIQAGKLELRLQTLDLQSVIRDACEEIDHTDRSIELTLPTEPIQFVADPEKLHQVLANLLTNADKYSDPGKNVYIEARVLRDDIQISIRDHGIGIPKDQQDEIFAQFFRASTGRQKATGMGLGLYIAKEIIEAHKGKIWVDSTPGEGSTFYLSLPLQQRLSPHDQHVHPA